MNVELKEVVMKLIGPVQPIGDHSVDERRLNNIQELTELTDFLLGEISIAAYFWDKPEASKKAIGLHAKNFLKDVAEITQVSQ